MPKKLFICLLVLLYFCTCLAPYNMIWADGANASVSFQPSSDAGGVKVGDTVTVTLHFSNDTAAISEIECDLVYKDSVLEPINISGGGGKLHIKESAQTPKDSVSVTLSFRAKAVGKSAFTVENCHIWDENSNVLGTPSAASGELTVKDKDTSTLKSSNANLKSLTVSYGALVPDFSPEITEYTVSVDYNVNRFPITALPEDDNAKETTVTGSQILEVGKNTRVITVTAEDGTQKQYTITILRAKQESTPTPSKSTATAGPTPTKKPASSQEESQIQWGTPAQDVTGGPASSNLPQNTTPLDASAPASTPVSTPKNNAGMTVNDLKNAMVTVVVIVSIIIIVILFTVVYCMQQSDRKKRGNRKR